MIFKGSMDHILRALAPQPFKVCLLQPPSLPSICVCPRPFLAPPTQPYLATVITHAPSGNIASTERVSNGVEQRKTGPVLGQHCEACAPAEDAGKQGLETGLLSFQILVPSTPWHKRYVLVGILCLLWSHYIWLGFAFCLLKQGWPCSVAENDPDLLTLLPLLSKYQEYGCVS